MTIYIKKLGVYLAMQYTGNNFKEIKEYFEDTSGVISSYMDGMLKLDTEHGRLAVRNGEYIVQDVLHKYSVCRKDDFEELYEAV